MPSAEFLIILAAIAAAWLSLRHDMRALTVELRKMNAEPDRDEEFDKALEAMGRIMSEPNDRAA